MKLRNVQEGRCRVAGPQYDQKVNDELGQTAGRNQKDAGAVERNGTHGDQCVFRSRALPDYVSKKAYTHWYARGTGEGRDHWN